MAAKTSRRLLLAGIGAAGLAACAPQGPATSGTLLKIGSQKGGTKALMLASGALVGAPYKVEWSEFAAAQPLLEAIAAGAVDVGAVGDAPFLFAFASGTPIKAVQASKASGGGAGTQILVG
ncbi:MAG TPA: aliphatic sulfonate ABC transporter substrate-binding protein, partial [Phenylobacterium sp.]